MCLNKWLWSNTFNGILISCMEPDYNLHVMEALEEALQLLIPHAPGPAPVAGQLPAPTRVFPWPPVFGAPPINYTYPEILLVPVQMYVRHPLASRRTKPSLHTNLLVVHFAHCTPQPGLLPTIIEMQYYEPLKMTRITELQDPLPPYVQQFIIKLQEVTNHQQPVTVQLITGPQMQWYDAINKLHCDCLSHVYKICDCILHEGMLPTGCSQVKATFSI